MAVIDVRTAEAECDGRRGYEGLRRSFAEDEILAMNRTWLQPLLVAFEYIRIEALAKEEKLAHRA